MFVDVKTGAVQSITTGAGTSAAPNGLSSPSLIDVDNDGKADFAYAGDIDGKMWKFDLTAATMGGWKVAFSGVPLFDGGSSKPITTAPQVATHPEGGFLIYYGTGKNYTTGDTADNSIQSIYGLWDTKTTPITPNLLPQTFSRDLTYMATGISEKVRTLTTAKESWKGSTIHTGWKVDLPAGERVLVPVKLRAGRLKVITTNPTTMDNWLLEFAYLNGGAALGTICDLDKNGKLDYDDRVDSNNNGIKTDRVDIPMGWQRENGIMSAVNIAQLGGGGQDTMFINYLQPSTASVCVGDCEGGIEGGHIDVDTIQPLDSDRYGHIHDYDTQTNRTFVDLFDIQGGVTFEGGNVTHFKGINEITPSLNSGISNSDKEFIVVVANADLSKNSTITIGEKQWNVVEYQKMIQKKLSAWDGVSPLLDGPTLPDGTRTGDSLIFKLAADEDSLSYKINGSNYVDNGTIRHTFSSKAIINGGLHPSGYLCVKDNKVHNGRYRNGALVTQIIDASEFSTLGIGDDLSNIITFQKPDDLITAVQVNSTLSVSLQDGDGTTYGGLLAKEDKGFLYETSLFWHYSGYGSGGFCYGDDEYAADVADTIAQIHKDAESAVTGGDGGLSQTAYDRLLLAQGFNTVEQLDAKINSLNCSNGNSNTRRKCREEKARLEELRELEKSIVSGSGAGGTGTGSGTPGGIDTSGGVKVVSAASKTGLNAGRNFKMGRRSWVDITPR
jgi:hypothetical protein